MLIFVFMNPASVHNSTSLAQFILRNEGHSCTVKTLLSFFISILFTYSSFAQDSTIKFTPSDFKQNHGDTIYFNKKDSNLNLRNNLRDLSSPSGKDRMGPNRRRIKIIAATNIIGYGAAMGALYSTWYKNYPQSNFHVFNDIPEW